MLQNSHEFGRPMGKCNGARSLGINRALRLPCIAALFLSSWPAMWAARGTTSASDSNAIVNSSYEPLSQGNGPFTIAFWFKSGNTNPGQSYIIEGGRSSTQWAVIYGYVSGQIEFFTGSAAVRVNTGISIKDTNWHHIAYRKSG